MKFATIPMVGGIFCAAALTLSGQTFPSKDVSPVGADFFHHLGDDLVGGSIIFNKGSGKATDPYSVDPSHQEEAAIPPPSGALTVYDLCAEILAGPSDRSPIRAETLTTTQKLELRKLFSNRLGNSISAHLVDEMTGIEAKPALSPPETEAIPEPSASLLGLFGAGLLLRRRRD